MPGKDVGELLLPAARLGLQFQYLVAGADYDPGWVYVTTDVGVAHAFASRYLTGDGREIPGDVYQVEPVGGVQLDPDNNLFAESFARTPRARIVSVVARAVALTVAEQAQAERRYTAGGEQVCEEWRYGFTPINRSRTGRRARGA